MVNVVNIRKDRKYDIYIGRGSKWENPFVIGADGNRFDVVVKYHWWVIESGLMCDLWELKDKVLGCYCAPKLCHGDVLGCLVDFDRFDVNWFKNVWCLK